ncbi:MAG: DUF2062 domain-containing protein [Pleurocapsa sp.]
MIPHKPKFNKRTKRKRSWLARKFRLIYLRLIRLRGNPQAIATGLASGIFAGFFPFLGLQTIVGIVLATIFRGSKVAAVAATWVSNPLTYLPIFVFNYKIGQSLLGVEAEQVLASDFESLAALKETGFTFIATLLTGCFVVGAIAAVITYFYSLAILERMHDRKFKKKSPINR